MPLIVPLAALLADLGFDAFDEMQLTAMPVLLAHLADRRFAFTEFSLRHITPSHKRRIVVRCRCCACSDPQAGVKQFPSCARAEEHVFGAFQLDEPVLTVKRYRLVVERLDGNDRTPRTVAHLEQFGKRGNKETFAKTATQ